MTFRQLYFSMKGRIDRETCFVSAAKIFVVYLILFWMIVIAAADNTIDIVHARQMALLALIWPSFAIAVKRLHDRKKSAWWCLVFFIPYIGQAWAILELGFLPGTSGENRFGLEPPSRINVDGDNSTATSSPPPPRSKGTSDDVAELPSDLVDLISMLAKMAKSDGLVSREEIDVVDEFFKQVLFLSTKHREEAISVFTLAKNTDFLFEHHARRFYASNIGNHELLSRTLSLFFSIATADNEMSAEEEILLSQVIAIFGVECQEYSAYRARQKKQSIPRGEAKEKHYATTLGLQGAVTKETVKKAYRDLVKQYHPDQVAHLGEKLRLVAEDEMKKINEAYDYFSKNFTL